MHLFSGFKINNSRSCKSKELLVWSLVQVSPPKYTYTYIFHLPFFAFPYVQQLWTDKIQKNSLNYDEMFSTCLFSIGSWESYFLIEWWLMCRNRRTWRGPVEKIKLFLLWKAKTSWTSFSWSYCVMRKILADVVAAASAANNAVDVYNAMGNQRTFGVSLHLTI